MAFDGFPETVANAALAGIIEHRIAFHNADLLDEERGVVERRLLEDKIDEFVDFKKHPMFHLRQLRVDEIIESFFQ